MTHALKRLKCDDVTSGEDASLTWQMDENDSEIMKRRQGQFPSWKAPKKESIFSRLHDLAMEENISDTEMEVVPMGKMVSNSKPLASRSCGYESSDSAGSADTDEIISKASHKTSSERTPSAISKSSHKASERMPSVTPKPSHKTSSERTPSIVSKSSHKTSSPSVISESSHKTSSERTPSSVKNCLPKSRPVKTNSKKNHESDGSNSPYAADTEETPTKVPSKKRLTDLTPLSSPSVGKPPSVDSSDSDAVEEGRGPQFKFVKNKTVQGRCLKKSAKMSQPKTPPFRGLGMLLSEDENEDKERMRTSPLLSERKVLEPKSGKKQSPESPQSRGLTLLSDGREHSVLPATSPERTSDKVVNISPKLRKTVPDLKSFSSPSSSTSRQLQQKGVAPDLKNADDVLTTVRTPKGRESGFDSAHKQQLNKRSIEEFASGIEEGSPLAGSSHQSRRSRLEESDDSDLDDNDFELVGKKLEALAKRQQDKHTKADKGQQRGVSGPTSTTATGIHSTNKRKRSLVINIFPPFFFLPFTCCILVKTSILSFFLLPLFP